MRPCHVTLAKIYDTKAEVNMASEPQPPPAPKVALAHPKIQSCKVRESVLERDKPGVITFAVPTVLAAFLPFISSPLSVCLVSSCHGIDLWLLWGIRV